MYIITGIGRSGTTFIAEIFTNLGHDMGGDINYKINGGRESKELVEVNEHLMMNNTIDEEYVNQIMNKAADNHTIVKDPRCMMTIDRWIREIGDRIDGIILCIRDEREIVASSCHGGGMIPIFNRCSDAMKEEICKLITDAFINIVTNAGIPLHIIEYPESMHDFNSIKDALLLIEPDESKLHDAWEKSIKPRPSKI